MAKIMHGSLAGAVSGAEGNVVYSHNRYGAYIRARVIPTKRQTQWTNLARGILGAASKAFGGLTEVNRQAWETWAASNPITDRLGQKQVMDPHAAYVTINSRILRCGGTMVSAPPIVAPPSLPAGLAVTMDTGAGAMAVTWTGGALSASEVLWLEAATTCNPGVRYFGNLMKLITVSAVSQSSPYDYQSDLEGRFGAVATGQGILMRVRVCSKVSGRLSAYQDFVGSAVHTS